MALPWVLTTAVLVSLPLVIGSGVADLATGSLVVSVAYAVALLVAGPIQIVVSRYAADRLYEGRLRAIAAPLCRGLGVTLLVCGVVAASGLFALGLPVRSTICGAALSAAVGAQWAALSVGNGLCSPGLVLGAVGAGSGLSFVLAAALASLARLGTPGYLFGLIVGQTATLVILLVGIFRALPREADENASLLPAFRDFAALAGAGLAFNASLWADRLLVWWRLGAQAAARHAEASTLAWFSTIPCLAWVFVEVETAFHRRFRRFYSTLEGGAALGDLRLGVLTLEREAVRLLTGALSIQAGVTLFLQLAAGPWARWAGMPPEAVLPFRLLLCAAGAQAVGLLGLIILYYFDLRREACLAALGVLFGVATCTLVALQCGFPPSTGTAFGCALGAVQTWRAVFRGIRAVLEHTLLGQPYGSEHADASGS